MRVLTLDGILQDPRYFLDLLQPLAVHVTYIKGLERHCTFEPLIGRAAFARRSRLTRREVAVIITILEMSRYKEFRVEAQAHELLMRTRWFLPTIRRNLTEKLPDRFLVWAWSNALEEMTGPYIPKLRLLAGEFSTVCMPQDNQLPEAQSEQLTQQHSPT